MWCERIAYPYTNQVLCLSLGTKQLVPKNNFFFWNVTDNLSEIAMPDISQGSYVLNIQILIEKYFVLVYFLLQNQTKESPTFKNSQYIGLDTDH